jgi:hypothetical protein
METKTVASGLPAFDQVVQGLRLGDNVVWRVDRMEHYAHFAEPFARQTRADGRRLVTYSSTPA